MYAVIFRAQPGIVDDDYVRTAARLRELALSSFGCLEFISASEGSNEVAISYWPDEDSIRRWKAHAEHVLAQELGRAKWYASYTVQIAKIEREYCFQAAV